MPGQVGSPEVKIRLVMDKTKLRAELAAMKGDFTGFSQSLGARAEASSKGLDTLEKRIHSVSEALKALKTNGSLGGLATGIGASAGELRTVVAELTKVSTATAAAQANLAKTATEMANFRAQARPVATDLKGVGQGASQAAEGLEKAAEASQGTSQAFESLKHAAQVVIGLAAIKSTVTSLVDAQLQYQSVLYTMSAATGDLTTAREEFDWLRASSNKMGTDMNVAAQAYSSFAVAAKTANIPIEHSRKLFESLSGATTVLHLSSEKAGRAMYALEQMMSLGAIRSEELRLQLGEALPGAYNKFQELASAKLKEKGSPFDFKTALERGLLDIQTFGPVMAEAIAGLYTDEQLADASKGLNAQINRFNSSFMMLKTTLSEGTFEHAASSVVKVATLLTQGLEGMAKGIAPQIVTWGLGAGALLIYGKAATKVATQSQELYGALAKKVAGMQMAKTQALELAITTEANAQAQQNEALQTHFAAQAQVEQNVVRQRALVAAVAEMEETVALTRAKGMEAIATGELTLAEGKLAAAKAQLATAQAEGILLTGRETAAKKAAEVANVNVAKATTQVGVAAAEATTKVGLGARALSGLAATGGALFTAMGGWVTVALAAAAGVYYLVTRTTEHEDAMKSLTETYEALNKAEGASIELALKGSETRKEDLRTRAAQAQQLIAQKEQELREVEAKLTGGVTSAGTQDALVNRFNSLTRAIAGARNELGDLNQGMSDLAAYEAAAEARKATYDQITEEKGAIGNIMGQVAGITARTAEVKRKLRNKDASESEDVRAKADADLKELEERYARLTVLATSATSTEKAGKIYEQQAKDTRKLKDAVKEYVKVLEDLEVQKAKEASAKVAKEKAEKQKKDLEALTEWTKKLGEENGNLADRLQDRTLWEGKLNEHLREQQKIRRDAEERLKKMELGEHRAEAEAEINRLLSKREEILNKLLRKEKQAAEAKGLKEFSDLMNNLTGAGVAENVERRFAVMEQFAGIMERMGAVKGSPEFQAYLEDVLRELEKADKLYAMESNPFYKAAKQIFGDMASTMTSAISNALQMSSDELKRKARSEAEQKLSDKGIDSDAVDQYEDARYRLENSGLDEGSEEYQKRKKELDELRKSAEVYKKEMEGLDDGFNSLSARFGEVGKAFADMIQKMAAELAASSLMDLLKQLAQAGINAYFGVTPPSGTPIGSGGSYHTPMTGDLKLASGGPVNGPGTKTSDSVPAYLSKGEYVVRAAAVDRYGKDFLDRVNGMSWSPGNRVQKFAEGGYVGATSAGGGGGATVEVHNYSGQPVTTEKTKGPNGQDLVKMVIGEVAKDIRSGGVVRQSMQGTFGLAPKGTSRG